MAGGGGSPAVGGEAPAAAPDSRGWRTAVGRRWWRGHLAADGSRRMEGGGGGEGRGGGGWPRGLAGAVDALWPAGEAGSGAVGRWRLGIAGMPEPLAASGADKAERWRTGMGSQQRRVGM
uniref:Uncharacterized protein n=1 Tax=Oryza sativa subsp. japonica TaxID=39947 RepID=Q6YZ55_ORYSJ|nr:hypothetical protein [Oryza sativa Japonica Group]BAD17374.1 hypothetical protein [Oryza sativa Japonica Group]